MLWLCLATAAAAAAVPCLSYQTSAACLRCNTLSHPILAPPPPHTHQVEDVKLTEQHIQFAEVACPGHVSPACRSFIQQVGGVALRQTRMGKPVPAS